MNRRFSALAITCAASIAIAAGQTNSTVAKPAASNTAPATKTTKAYTPPKLPWGDPDLQGQWPASLNIPMQRPANMGARNELTDAELAQRQAQAARQAEGDAEEFVQPDKATVTINPPGYWVERAKPNRQASLIVDPPDGRTPPMTPEARKIVQSERGGLGPGNHFPDKVDSWEDFDMYSRCITRGMPSSMLPTLYDFGNQLLQAPGYVVIRSEMIHETRVIPLDGRPHVGKAVSTYMGDSRGHWEGNTLVVETTNLKAMSGIGGARYTGATVIVERFTRTAPNTLSYQATISDPNVWTKPWTISYPFPLDPNYTIYEYACTEGNYMMLNSLKGARELEKEGKDTKVSRGDAGGPPLPAQ